MKHITLSVVAALFATITSFAQTNEGKITYEIKMSTDNPEIELQLAMMKNSKMEMTYSGSKSRQVITMGGFITTTTISDADSGESLTLMDGMMGKFATRSNTSGPEEEDGEMEFEFVDETRDILGFKCYKASFVGDDGGEATFWYTKEMAAPKVKNGYFHNGIPGMPLSFQVVAPEITMEFIATDVQLKLKKGDKSFDMGIPEGFQEMEPEAFGGMMGE